MNFEVFNRRSARMTKDPQITIQKRGTLSLNASAAALIAESEEDPEKVPVELLYDTELRVVGLRRAEDEMNAYYLRKQKNSESYLLAGKAFTEHFGIETGTARRYKVRQINEGIIGFGLDDPHQEVGRG